MQLFRLCAEQPAVAKIALPLRVLAAMCSCLVRRPIYTFFHHARDTALFPECFEAAVADIVAFFARKDQTASEKMKRCRKFHYDA